MAKRLENVGAAAIMPLAAPIGSGLGLQNKVNISLIIKQSKVLGAKKVFLEVRSKNFNAISFYKKYKFVQDALRINYYAGNNPDDAVMMSLDI